MRKGMLDRVHVQRVPVRPGGVRAERRLLKLYPSVLVMQRGQVRRHVPVHGLRRVWRRQVLGERGRRVLPVPFRQILDGVRGDVDERLQ